MRYDDEVTLGWAADDFGHHVHLRPAQVLRPTSVADIQAVLAEGLPVRPRGQGHSAYGQAQISGGVVVDMSAFATIHAVRTDRIVVDAGARWSSVLAATLPAGLTPPVLTDYLEISVGGTLSAGGIGGASHQHGLQVDNVLVLEVLTTDGQIVTCGPGDKLFDLVRGGAGRHGIILRATIPLIPAPTRVRRHLLRYPDLPTFLADQRALLASRRFGYLEGQAKPGWEFEIEAVTYGSASVDGLRYSSAEPVEDLSYFDFLNRVAEGETFLREVGDWHRPHPWIEVFLPDDATDAFLTGLVAESTWDGDLGENGVFLVYPVDTTLITAPSPRLPRTPTVFLAALLRTARDPATLGAMLAANARLRRRAEAVGGTIYQDSPAGEGGIQWT
ncbi:hypothetical protein GCM10029964_015740 [Kibdelosporangium lantanae]